MADGTRGITPADRERLVGLAARIGMTEWSVPEGTLISVGDAETFYELVVEGLDVVLVEVQRGVRRQVVRASSVNEAVTFLVLVLDPGYPAPTDQAVAFRPSYRPAARRAGSYQRRLETSPPDLSAADELVQLDLMAAYVDWWRRDQNARRLFEYGNAHGQGRALHYRGEMFHYESTVDDSYRKTVAAFSTAQAARRFLACELGSWWRLQQGDGLPVIRAARAAPGRTVTSNPTEVQADWEGGTATFARGPVGQQQALVFSWCVGATLPAIAASCRDPRGLPLFEGSSTHSL